MEALKLLMEEKRSSWKSHGRITNRSGVSVKEFQGRDTFASSSVAKQDDQRGHQHLAVSEARNNGWPVCACLGAFFVRSMSTRWNIGFFLLNVGVTLVQTGLLVLLLSRHLWVIAGFNISSFNNDTSCYSSTGTSASAHHPLFFGALKLSMLLFLFG